MAFVLLAASGASGVSAAQDAYSLNEQLLNAVRAGDEAGVTRALGQGRGDRFAQPDRRHGAHQRVQEGLDADGALLIERGANVSQADVQGITPLMAAAFDGNEEIVALLLASHADVSATDRVGKTAIEYASGRGHTAVVQRLLDAAST